MYVQNVDKNFIVPAHTYIASASMCPRTVYCRATLDDSRKTLLFMMKLCLKGLEPNIADGPLWHFPSCQIAMQIGVHKVAGHTSDSLQLWLRTMAPHTIISIHGCIINQRYMIHSDLKAMELYANRPRSRN